VIVAGENTQTAAGGAQDVVVIGDYVYLARGGEGVAVYRRGEIERLAIFDTPVAAKHLAVVGSRLAVADIGGVELFSPSPQGGLIWLARERGARRTLGGSTSPKNVSFRTWHGVAAWGSERLVAADWDSVDVYELVDPLTGRQADVTASSQRRHFPPTGGSVTIELRNDGAKLLEMDRISTQPMFSVSPASGALFPGESMELTIDYAGGRPGSALVLIESNDADEAPLPIQVFGDTEFVDPGEPAPAFSLESWTYDPARDEFASRSFALSAHRRKFIFLHIFGTW
jgi:hypothetical protein